MTRLPRTYSGAIVLLVLTGIIAVYIYFHESEGDQLASNIQVTHEVESKVNGRKIIGLPEGKNEVPKDLKLSNTVSDNWKNQLEKDLKVQGGETLKEIHITKEASLIWIQNDAGMNVESVKIAIKNTNNEEIQFRALIDSQNGKILETWDRPIEDLSNPKKGYRLKLDPRNFHQ